VFNPSSNAQLPVVRAKQCDLAGCRLMPCIFELKETHNMKPIEEMTLIEKVVLLRELLCSVAENPQFRLKHLISTMNRVASDLIFATIEPDKD
jgi:hypothetical protein